MRAVYIFHAVGRSISIDVLRHNTVRLSFTQTIIDKRSRGDNDSN